MNSITQSGLASINSAFSLANQSAQTVAGSLTPTEESSATSNAAKVTQASEPTLTESLVDLSLAELQSKAGVKVLQTADEVLGTLIDTKV